MDPGRITYMKIRMILGCVLTWLTIAGPAAHAREQVYLQPDDFVTSAFPARTPQAQALWVTQDLRRELAEQFGWQPGMRVRYWQQGTRSAWILNEIGKDKPITAGILIDSGSIEDVQVLVFRESRGWEIRYPAFTSQFVRARLVADSDLSQTIDGISGATLSVRAMKRMARVALKLHEQINLSTLARSP